MFLFFDTETTGLPKRWQAPISDLNNWPRLVQLAWLLMDEEGKEINGQNYIIKPEGFIIPKEASQVHGISTEQAEQDGIKLRKALNEFAEKINLAQLIVAHNINFDKKIIGAEFLRKEVAHGFFETPQFCTMQASVEYCALPSPNGYNSYKYPKLIELHNKLFNKDFPGAHDALGDVRATAKCFFELRKRGVF